MHYVFEIRIKIFTLQSISKEDSYAAVTDFIDGVLIENEVWEQMHNENCYKQYCFNGLYPIEKEGIYKREQVYQFIVRSTNKDLIEYLSYNLPKHENNLMKGLTCENRMISKKHITSLYSITPVIVKGKNNGYWRDDMTFEDFEQRLKVNLIKKYNELEHTKLDENFELHTLLEFKNYGPIPVPYKNVKLLADKIELKIADNETAQALAYMALGTGICEMNSRGMGFVNCHYV
ncbi:MAG: CRISPR-associated endoribonuclease Cas6 [Hungatella hathewayi]|uniref:CRISPR-associated protein cas6 n=1 Tax=Hungatella hathewayi WAL-18680 TaxID=742737 RepID=G5IMA5_9FIRM|nr:CRISPR-associated endoribonuclease Cas6 [Hungatella hathewayi]EHI57524.1 CRISPR-associated protein cas6 [ [Hungatella hathewayi WAL-18680]MBS4984557.1 CRISPR-associated endoribonuclease Cas6 [Hungatella hathewayi]